MAETEEDVVLPDYIDEEVDEQKDEEDSKDVKK